MKSVIMRRCITYVCIYIAAGSNADIVYQLLTVTPPSRLVPFSINSMSGVISTAVELDREEVQLYNLIFEVSHLACICTYVCMYICMYVHMYVRMYAVTL